ncbi:hypothetical protein [Rarobacter faecitabidus]
MLQLGSKTVGNQDRKTHNFTPPLDVFHDASAPSGRATLVLPKY